MRWEGNGCGGNRNHLDADGMTEQLWRNKWDAARLFLTADGEFGKAGGNDTIRVDEAGRLRIKVPGALAGELGTHLVLAARVQFHHRRAEWAGVGATSGALRHQLRPQPRALVFGRVLDTLARAGARPR